MSEQSGKPGRYQRSASGLVASLLVTGVLVLLVVWLMGLFRNPPAVEPVPVEYLEGISAAQDGDHRPVYPPTLPHGWIATGFEVDPGGGASYGLKLLTDRGRFAGVRQAEESVTALLRAHVAEDDAEIDGAAPYVSESSVARDWRGYVDEGGDTAYAVELDDTTVLVYGSAPAEDLQELIDRLTREPLAD